VHVHALGRLSLGVLEMMDDARRSIVTSRLRGPAFSLSLLNVPEIFPGLSLPGPEALPGPMRCLV